MKCPQGHRMKAVYHSIQKLKPGSAKKWEHRYVTLDNYEYCAECQKIYQIKTETSEVAATEN